jgi:hypothetical protein
MKFNHPLRIQSYKGCSRIPALAIGILSLATGAVLARDPGRGVGGAGVGRAGVAGVGVLPAGYYAAVPAGYATVAYRGYTCRYVGGVYYRAATYQGQTVWIVVQ